MDFFSDARLLRKDGSYATVGESLQGKSVLALYFSAHWCPPCRTFTPMLKQAFAMSGSSKTSVVFVSSDRSKAEQLNYMREAHGDWPAVECGTPLASELSSHFGVRGIPALIVINASDGSVITKDGRTDVMRNGAGSFALWESQAIEVVTVDTSVVDLLNDNPDKVRKEAGEILLKLINNVRKDPQNIKYRSIRLSNPKIESKLLNANGAFEILFSIGFEEADDSLILPLSVPMPTLNKFCEAINEVVKPEIKNRVLPSPSTPRPQPSSQPMSNGQLTEQENASLQMKAENEFYQKLVNQKNHVMKYEDPAVQAAARSILPMEKLQLKAKEKLEVAKTNDPSLKPEFLQDFLLLELLEWFKNEFFSWFDQPTCDDGITKAVPCGNLDPTLKEQNDGASVVEGYKCPNTDKIFRFPRYHSKPEKLLETRKGRCGEWANCFALLCRTVGLDTRHVIDWTDHVWVEIWSQAQERWLHADPCENICDKPLVYEVGWGKKLTYVIATSKDELQDVSWRYSKDHEAMRSRRNLVRSTWLSQLLNKLTDDCQRNYGEEEKKKLATRRLVELVELMTVKSDKGLTSEELSARQSGSQAWRTARGESGSTVQLEKNVWKLSKEEIESKVFHLEYDVVKDEYVRVSKNNEKTKGWQNGVSEVKNSFRKEEKDWGQIYLARTEGSDRSNIKWEIDLSDSAMTVKSIEMNVASSTFESGRIVWQLCGGNICLLPQPGITLRSEELSGAKAVSISASMSGGKGDTAWQHTQLFRTHKDEKDQHQFRVVIKLQSLE